MRLKLDKAGRVYLPKALRLRYGLRSATELEVEEDTQEFALRAVRSNSSLVNDNGVWIHQGIPSRNIDLVKQVRKSRERKGSP